MIAAAVKAAVKAALAVALCAFFALCGAASAATQAQAQATRAETAAAIAWQPCRLDGVERAARCGSLSRPLDPSKPDGARFELQLALLPAQARIKAPDPVFFLAGGPGQSAIALAGQVAARLAPLTRRHDIVLVDQRGTGRSAPLYCPGIDDEADSAAALRARFDPASLRPRLAACRAALERLPHGDLRQFTSAHAAADIDAVRRALGAERIDVVGVSYGTRLALEVIRPAAPTVRRAVLDGVVPPDMGLPAAASIDNQAALDAMFDACAREPACARRHPQLRAQWQSLLRSLGDGDGDGDGNGDADRAGRELRLADPLSGRATQLRLTRAGLLGLVRAPLYLPSLAAALPLAIAAASEGDFAPLAALAQALEGRRAQRIASGLHFALSCSEDVREGVPASQPSTTDRGRHSGPRDEVAADFGDDALALYRDACSGWPRATLPAGFDRIAPATMPVLLLAGGADPATPPRHARRVATALGANARLVVVETAGHGLLGAYGCVRELATRFIAADGDAEALRLRGDCAAAVPRPTAFALPAFALPDAVPAAPAAPAAAAASTAPTIPAVPASAPR